MDWNGECRFAQPISLKLASSSRSCGGLSSYPEVLWSTILKQAAHIFPCIGKVRGRTEEAARSLKQRRCLNFNSVKVVPGGGVELEPLCGRLSPQAKS